MRILNSLLVLLMFCGFAHAVEIPTVKKLVIIGDSLTEGYGVSREQAYPALLQGLIDKSGRSWRVVNAGISGSTSASAESRVRWYLKQKPDLLIIALGANDGLRGIPAKTMQENLDRALIETEKAGIKTILAGIKLPPNYGEAYRKQFDAAYESLAKKHKTPYIPFLLEGVGGRDSLNLVDGIHPNEKGHAVIAGLIFKAIEKYL